MTNNKLYARDEYLKKKAADSNWIEYSINEQLCLSENMLLFVGFIIFCDLVLKLFMIEVKNTINCVKYTLNMV